jgi:hypothetical protein
MIPTYTAISLLIVLCHFRSNRSTLLLPLNETDQQHFVYISFKDNTINNDIAQMQVFCSIKNMVFLYKNREN